MKVHGLSRRMFLQGSGGFLLGIPTLVSLLQKPERAAAQAATPPVRWVQWITDHGQFDANFWPAAQWTPSEQTPVAGIKTRALGAIEGRMSLVLGPEFDAVRGKMNLLRGLNLIYGRNLHNACAPTCASWPREDNHIPAFSHSIDSIMEKSAKVYPSPSRVPALRLTPGVKSAYKWGSFSWTTQNGQAFKLPAHDSTAAALNSVFPGGAGGGGGKNDPTIAARTRLTDQVYGDYRAVAGSSALSTADRLQLSHYMDLLADLQKRMSIEAPACTPPSQLSQSDFDVLHTNAIDIAVVAMACGATRVVAYHCYQGSPSQYDEETFHAWAHNDGPKHGQMMVWRYKQLAKLIRRMDEVVDTDGKKLLDNSFLYANNELSDPGHGGRHLQNMPIVTAGGAGGKITTGQYIDFGKRLMNNLLITGFTVMGLEPSDYERNGVVGFGDYDGNNQREYAAYLGPAERRSPLPYLYKG